MKTRNIGTILVQRKTRTQLKEIGKKGQTYDEVISELLDLKRKNMVGPIDSRIDSLPSRGSSST
jgi:hypothetical protein